MAEGSDVDSDVTAVSDSLYQRGSTDGLPITPPTEERAGEMLRGTDLDPDEELGRLGNREGLLTVEKVAINGVMAGCTPLHMPVLLAGARALVDPEANAIQVSTSTGSWAYFWLLNGRIRDELSIGKDFSPGHQSNRRIGRALGLIYKNTALVHPGEKDMGVQGSPFKYDLIVGENEEANPWEPLHVSQSFEPSESTLTLGGPNSFIQYSTDGNDAEDILKRMIYNSPPCIERVSETGHSVWAIHGLCPNDAHTLQKAGFTKTDVKKYLLDNSDLVSYKQYSGINREVDEDTVDPLQPEHHPNPDQMRLPVIGEGSGENVIIGPSLPGLVTKKIEYPHEWDRLLEDYSDR